VKPEIEVIVSGEAWLFVNVTVFTTAALTTTVPKSRLAGLRVTAPMPEPVRLTICGVLGASSLIVSELAGVAPTLVGLYVKLMTQLPPAATGVPTRQVVVPGTTV